MMTLRHATRNDIELLRRWDRQPHVIEAGGGDWDWKNELGQPRKWREQWIAELGGHPIGFVQVIDPALEESHYWGEIGPGFRAIDIWLGEREYLGKGYGTTIMRKVISHCFEDEAVKAILMDPLARNTRAHRFYERMGFRFLERRWFGGDDCFVFQLQRGDHVILSGSTPSSPGDDSGTGDRT